VVTSIGEVGTSNSRTMTRLLSLPSPLNFIVASKLKALKVDSRKWNKEMFGDVGRKKNILWEEICTFVIIEEQGALGYKERMNKTGLLSE
jgi:hypothetical protein